jgi:hypothetical protein
MPLTTPHAPHAPLSGTMLDALTREIHARTPRANAAEEIAIQPVPMRTCYETMTRLHGPSASVLDYAAFLFAEETHAKRGPTPPLTVDEADLDSATGELTLVLTRGTFIER